MQEDEAVQRHRRPGSQVRGDGESPGVVSTDLHEIVEKGHDLPLMDSVALHFVTHHFSQKLPETTRPLKPTARIRGVASRRRISLAFFGAVAEEEPRPTPSQATWPSRVPFAPRHSRGRGGGSTSAMTIPFEFGEFGGSTGRGAGSK